MSEVKRYYLTDDFIDGPAMEESPSGDYYKVSDIEPILVAAQAVVDAYDGVPTGTSFTDAIEALRAALDPIPGRTTE